MSRMNKAAYQRLIEENTKWLLDKPPSPERDHIGGVLCWSVDALYFELKKGMTKHPLCVHGLDHEIPFVLRSLAAQEGCDGEPYDQMQDAAEYIDSLERKVKSLERRVSAMSHNILEKGNA